MVADRLAFWLEGYDEDLKDFLINGFRFGFKVGYEGSPISSTPSNLGSVQDHPDIINAYIDKELAAGRILGPFHAPPFSVYQCSLIGLVPKKDKDSFRVIHHLSYPEGESINDHIPPEKTRVVYQSVTDAVEMLSGLCKKAFMAKTDIHHAFRIIPIHPDEHHLFLLHWQDSFYIDTVLAMGCASSCRIFEAFSNALAWILQSKLNIPSVHYLDDFLLGSVSEQIGSQDLKRFLALCHDIGVPIADKKTFPPSTVMGFLGMEIGTIEEIVRIPQDKIATCVQLIEKFLVAKKVTLRDIQSLVGLLNFVCQAVVPGRAFLRRLIDATRGVRKPYFNIRMSKGIKDDLSVWLKFLQDHNGRFFLDNRVTPTHDVELFTDASAQLGYGAVFGNQWFSGEWEEWWKDQNIMFLELYPIVVALEVWGTELQNKQLVLHTDNLALVTVLRKQTSKDTLCF